MRTVLLGNTGVQVGAFCLGTMHLGKDEVTRGIRAREDTQIIEITRANRNELPRRLADLLKQAAGVATDSS